MSKYTISILELIRQYTADSTLPISRRIDLAIPKIFDFNFPIYEESHRVELERKILMHYLNKEIGLETPDLWKLYLENRFNEIMPYYNELYRLQNEMMGIDFLHDTDLKINEEHSDTESGTQENKLDTTNETIGKNTEKDTLSSTVTKTESTVTNSTGTTTNTTTSSESVENKEKGTQSISDSSTSVTTVSVSENGSSNTLTSSFPQGRLAGGNYADNSSDTTTKNTSTSTNNVESTDNKTITDDKTATQTSNSQTKNDGSNSDKTETSQSSKNEQSDTRDNLQNKNLNSSGSQSGTENFENNNSGSRNEKKYGLSGNRTIASMILEYRDSILNIDKMIIDDLADLFITIY